VLPTVTRLLGAGERRMTALLDALTVETIPEAEWRRLDPSGASVRNVNRPGDLAVAGRGS
jgi:molybdopterin-guanine dinucleotide biosynthesis protein A